jgi:ElaB/YqjD/DUF883 family membrane-anchored ribosome-binding protein
MEKTLQKDNGHGDPTHSFSEALASAKEHIGPSLKSAFAESAGHLSTLADETRKQVVEKSKHASKAVNRNVHSNPWPYIAGAGVVGMALGYFLVRRK